jgi:hypothetical protein
MAPQVLDVEAWRKYLAKTPTSGGFTAKVKEDILEYLIHGVDIHLDPGVVPSKLKCRKCRNLPTSRSLEQQVKLLEDFQKEVELGRRAGPFRRLPNPHLQLSPLGTVPKKHSFKLRTILHLSYPRDGSCTSVNSQIKELECDLLWFGVVVQEIIRRGRGCLMAKFDIKDAFRLVRVKPGHQTMLGMKFMEWYFVELALPFGLKSAPALFEMFSTAIENFIRGEGVDSIFHYLDDFLLLSMSMNQSLVEYDTVLRVFRELGVELAKEKLATPSTRLEFLGLILDTDSMTIELPQDKLTRYRATLEDLRARREATVEELQQLVGVLVYSAMVIQYGRSFYYHLIQMMKNARMSWKKGACSTVKLPLSAGALRELEWWSTFIVAWNGKSMIAPSLSDFEPPEVHRLYTDACMTGMGAWFDGSEYISHVWDHVELARAQRCKTLSMPYLELLALTHAVGVWRERLRGRALLIKTDCMDVVTVFQKGYSNEGNMMILLRQLAFFTATENIFIHVSHIPGKENVVADCLSRLTSCSSDSLIDFSPFFDLKEVKERRDSGVELVKREVRAFPAMNWNGLVQNSKAEL